MKIEILNPDLPSASESSVKLSFGMTLLEDFYLTHFEGQYTLSVGTDEHVLHKFSASTPLAAKIQALRFIADELAKAINQVPEAIADLVVPDNA